MTKSQGPMTATGFTPFESRTVILVSLKWPDTVGVPDRKHLHKHSWRVSETKPWAFTDGTHERLSDSPAGRSTRSPGSCLSQVICWYVGPVPVWDALPTARLTTWSW